MALPCPASGKFAHGMFIRLEWPDGLDCRFGKRFWRDMI